MLRITATQLVIFALLSLPFSHTRFAQSLVPIQEAKTETQPAGVPDLKSIIARNEQTYRERSATVDVKAMEKIARQTPKGNGLTGKQKAYIVLGVVGLAALVFVLVKYGKNCKTYSPAGCSSLDDNCTCTDYHQNL